MVPWGVGDEADELAETEFKNAAWYYPEPKEKAKNIKDHVAFCEYHTFFSWPISLVPHAPRYPVEAYSPSGPHSR